MTKEELKTKIKNAICSKRWLYWPPGPMLGQVFDKEQYEKDMNEWLNDFKLEQ